MNKKYTIDILQELVGDKYIILGNNATGKTSLMEAIYMIGMCKSYRTNFDSEIVLENKNYYNIISILDNNGKEEKVVLYYNNGQKKLTKNSARQTTTTKSHIYFNILSITRFSSGANEKEVYPIH